MSRLPVHAICGLTKHPQRGRVITELIHNSSFILASGDDLASCPTERQARPSAWAGRDVWTKPVKDLVTQWWVKDLVTSYLAPSEPRRSCLGDQTWTVKFDIDTTTYIQQCLPLSIPSQNQPRTPLNIRQLDRASREHFHAHYRRLDKQDESL